MLKFKTSYECTALTIKLNRGIRRAMFILRHTHVCAQILLRYTVNDDVKPLGVLVYVPVVHDETSTGLDLLLVTRPHEA